MVRTLFTAHDKTGCGRIDAAALSELCGKLGQHLDAEQLELAMSTLDRSGGGVIFERFMW